MTRNSFLIAKSLVVSLCFLSAGLTTASAQVLCPQNNSAGPIVVRNNHIFCGEVNAGVAGGYHSRPGGVNPVNTIGLLPGTNTNVPAGAPAGIYRLNNFNIINPATGAVAVKAFSTMFPDVCTMANVVAAIQNASAAAVLVGGNLVGPSGPTCLAGPAPGAAFNIRVVRNAAGQVITAFPNY